jgi:hypothetical protein
MGNEGMGGNPGGLWEEVKKNERNERNEKNEGNEKNERNEDNKGILWNCLRLIIGRITN